MCLCETESKAFAKSMKTIANGFLSRLLVLSAPLTNNRFSEQPGVLTNTFCRTWVGQASANRVRRIEENSLRTIDPMVIGRQFATDSLSVGSLDLGSRVVRLNLREAGIEPLNKNPLNIFASFTPFGSHITKPFLSTPSAQRLMTP